MLPASLSRPAPGDRILPMRASYGGKKRPAVVDEVVTCDARAGTCFVYDDRGGGYVVGYVSPGTWQEIAWNGGEVRVTPPPPSIGL